MENRLDGFADAYGESFNYHDENMAMLQWYSRRVIDCIRARKMGSVVSLGIGHRIVSKSILAETGEQLQKYLIIEGSAEIISQYRQEVPASDKLQILNCLFEEFTTTETFDAIEMGFVLEHVEDPSMLIAKFAAYLKPGGTVFFAVPNARSVHRLIGHSAGMLDDLYRLSNSDLELGHLRYFDLESLISTILRAGLKIVKKEGIYLKPFSTSQLKSLALPEEVQAALFKVGRDYPEITNAIYVEAVS